MCMIFAYIWFLDFLNSQIRILASQIQNWLYFNIKGFKISGLKPFKSLMSFLEEGLCVKI